MKICFGINHFAEETYTRIAGTVVFTVPAVRNCFINCFTYVNRKECGMTYKNAKDVLPEALLREIQRYADGEILYIPTKPASRIGWGDRSGARLEYEKRNKLIRTMYAQRCSYEELADKFYLSVDSIKKIIKQ